MESGRRAHSLTAVVLYDIHIPICFFFLLCLILDTFVLAVVRIPFLPSTHQLRLDDNDNKENISFQKFPYPFRQSSCHDGMHAWSTYQNGLYIMHVDIGRNNVAYLTSRSILEFFVRLDFYKFIKQNSQRYFDSNCLICCRK